MNRVISLLLIVFTITITGCISTPSSPLRTPQLPNDASYIHYSGNDHVAGNSYCKLQKFVHPQSKKVVSLLGMIHIADDSFYHAVQKELDQSDLVLMEGVGGNGNFGINSLFIYYLMNCYQRTADLQGLALQSEALHRGKNWLNADLTQAEMAKNSSIKSTILQTFVLPLSIIVIEPAIRITNSIKGLKSLINKQDAQDYQAAIRHKVFGEISKEKKKDGATTDKIMPGIITARNAHLLEVLKEKIKDDKYQNIIMPWGAMHLPDLEKSLLKLGYKKQESRWLRAIACSDLINRQATTSNNLVFRIPLLFSHHSYDKSKHTSLILDLLNLSKTKHGYSLNLAYHQLLSLNSYTKGSKISILPYFWNRPLLFEYKRNKNGRQVRFLLLFKIKI